ncbi:response regulator [candidate division KSB1 bacterium]|nr:response regulator [candidate division KSB1 bacterium]NIR69602.1 response regulator [candidate division KSB1 bacterium]NIS24319.1 response regulator [candidate division KSB1 bacterium]NIT71247.1 response regulator [candidate division KSB1 bacterium]NIU24951.1 response regulator [candidate division KSB1 bacterium]
MALERLQKIKYHLIISDFRLPHIHGLKLIQTAQKENRKCRFLLISASTPETIDFDIKKTPILGFMMKRFSPLELRDLVTKHFDSLVK